MPMNTLAVVGVLGVVAVTAFLAGTVAPRLFRGDDAVFALVEE